MRSLLLAVLVPVCVSALSAQSVDQLRKSFDERCEQAAATRDIQLEKLNTSYLGGLQRLLDKTKASGKLDAALPVHEEIEAVKHADPQLPPLPETALPELRQMRGKYQDGRHQILKTHATTLDGLASKMEAALKAREADLTKAGKIDDAVAARELLADMAKDKDLLAACDLLKLGGSTAKGKPALQLRRYGDNLEVLVYYDRAGKISMDSPVENTRERTGEGKELGDTKAKVLGEFVGAKGYTVDPYVAYDHKFDTKELGGMTISRLDYHSGFAIEDEKGLKLSHSADPGTARYAAIKDVLPPESAPGSYRITVRYLIPKANHALTSILFSKPTGGTMGSPSPVILGKWTTGVVESSLCLADSSLLLTLPSAPGTKPAEAQAEFVVIHSLKVEHTRFSAAIQQKFSLEGAPLEAERKASQQIVFVTDGSMVEKGGRQ